MQPGFLQDSGASSGPGELNVVTVVEWKSREAVEHARKAVLALRREIKFDRQETLTRLGIKAEIAEYQRV